VSKKRIVSPKLQIAPPTFAVLAKNKEFLMVIVDAEE
jgi:hypothetical protein